MPANLTPQYLEAERRFREAKEPQDKIAALEEMMAVIPKHKGTDHMRADLKRKMAKLRVEAAKRKGPKRALGHKVDPEGAGQVVLVGAPNCGKSRLVCQFTKASPEVAPYPFTTRVPTPGMMSFENVAIQLVDLPPISENYLEPWVPDVIRRADLVLLVVDLSEDPLAQLEAVEKILRQMKIGLIETNLTPGWHDKRTLVAANKLDAPEAAEVLDLFKELLPGRFSVLAVSAESGQGLEDLRQGIFRALEVLRVYTKAPGKDPDLRSPFVMPQGSTLADLAGRIHKDFLLRLKYARVWGKGTFQGGMVQRDYVLHEGDVVEFHIDARPDGAS
ncbi:MAG: GTPase [Pseudomonadota bacterium]